MPFDVYKAARRLVHHFTAYDARQAKKPNHNRNALPLYLEAIHKWEADKNTPTAPLTTLKHYFTSYIDTKGHSDFCASPVRKLVKEMGW